jgi:hypothetical protein
MLLGGVVLPAGVGYARPRARRTRRLSAAFNALLESAGPSPQEVGMFRQVQRWRLFGGIGLVVAAAIVAIVGYLRVSIEPDTARQVPLLMSAGLGTLILVVAGGSLLVADQIRAEDERVDEIEKSLARLAEVIGPTVEAPARVPEATGRRR